MSELKSIFSMGHEYNPAPGETVIIKEVELENLDAAVEIATSLNLKSGSILENLTEICKNNLPQIKKLISITTNLSSEQINKLNVAGVVLVVSKAIEVNANFLKEKVLPAVEGLVVKAKTLAGSDKSKS